MNFLNHIVFFLVFGMHSAYSDTTSKDIVLVTEQDLVVSGSGICMESISGTPAGAGIRLTLARTGKEPEPGKVSAFARIQQRIPKGTPMSVDFYARSISTGDPSGKGKALLKFHTYGDRQGGCSLKKELIFDKTWEKYSFNFSAVSDYEDGGAILHVSFTGFSDQLIDIAGLKLAVTEEAGKSGDKGRASYLPPVPAGQVAPDEGTSDFVVKTAKGEFAARYDKYEKIYFNREHHMLRSGTDFQFTIDASRIVKERDNHVSGVNISELSINNIPFTKSGEWGLSDKAVEMIRAMRIPQMRVYGLAENCITGKVDWDMFGSIDRLHLLSEELGIPEENIVLELTQWPKALRDVSMFGDIVRYVKQKGYKFRYIEITNEPYYDRKRFPNADAFIDYASKAMDQVRENNPDFKIAVSVKQTDKEHHWRAYILDSLAGKYDFASPHFYNGGKVDESFDDVVLANNWMQYNLALQIKDIMDDSDPGTDHRILDCEWAVNRKPPPLKNANWTEYNASLPGSFHRLVRWIYYALGDAVQGSSSWTLFAYQQGRIGFGMIPAWCDYDSTSMLYWSTLHFNNNIGPLVPETWGTCPYYRGEFTGNVWAYGGSKALNKYEGPSVPTLVTMNEEKTELYVTMVNGREFEDYPCSFTIENATVQDHEATILTADVEAYPIFDRKGTGFVDDIRIDRTGNTCSFTVPRHSALFIKIGLIP